MRSFDVRGLALRETGEYVLGKKDHHSEAVYLVYGVLRPGESDRLVAPGQGYEEILLAVDGPILMDTKRGNETLDLGRAIHIRESESFLIANPSDRQVVYVIAGSKLQPAAE